MAIPKSFYFGVNKKAGRSRLSLFLDFFDAGWVIPVAGFAFIFDIVDVEAWENVPNYHVFVTVLIGGGCLTDTTYIRPPQKPSRQLASDFVKTIKSRQTDPIDWNLADRLRRDWSS